MKLSVLVASAFSLMVCGSAFASQPELNRGLPVRAKAAAEVRTHAAQLGFANQPKKTIPSVVYMANGTTYAAATHVWTGGPKITVKAKPTKNDPITQKGTKKILWVSHQSGIEESGFAHKYSSGLGFGAPTRATPRANSDYGQVLEYEGGFSISTAGSDQRILEITTPWGTLPTSAAKYIVKNQRGRIISMYEGRDGQRGVRELVIVFGDGTGIIFNPATNAIREAAR